MKNKRNITILVVIVLMLAAGFVLQSRAGARATPEFRFVEVEQGDLDLMVSATGTLSAVTTVSVGTQVSGQVAQMFVDFNDPVKKGQLLARIDATLAQQAVTDAQASVERARADLDLAQREYSRNASLVNEGLLAPGAFDPIASRVAVGKANLKSAQVSLDRARQNLSFTEIHAPIDGVVVERNVDVGQTVAASLSAPQLFLIANDLSRMQILALVDESDIAVIQEGQPVRFTVQALPSETFTGRVQQVRLQSTIAENVVNYTVVVEVENRENKLLPGMTASLDFLVQSADDVMKVSNAALRFTPPASMMPERPQATGTAGGEARAQRRRGAGGGGSGRGTPGDGQASFGRLFYLDDAGAMKVARVRTGISDRSMTEIQGSAIKPGMKVIAGVTTPGAAATEAANPFGNRQQQGPQRRGPGGSF